MNQHFSDWYRAVNVNPTGALLEAKWGIVEALQRIEDRDITSLTLAALSGVAAVEDALVRDTAMAVDPTLSISDPTEMQILAACAILDALDTASERKWDIVSLQVAAAIWARAQPSNVTTALSSKAHERLTRRGAEMRAARRWPEVPNVTKSSLNPTDLDANTAAGVKNVGEELIALRRDLASIANVISRLVRQTASIQNKADEQADILWLILRARSVPLDSAMLVRIAMEFAGAIRFVLPPPNIADLCEAVLGTAAKKELTLSDAEDWTATRRRTSRHNALFPLWSNIAEKVTVSGEAKLLAQQIILERLVAENIP